MDTLTTEEQQIDAIKQWWKENGSSIVTGVVLGLAVLLVVVVRAKVHRTLRMPEE